MTKAVIFDWDGTLADTKRAVVQSFQRVLTEAGCKVNNEFIERRIGIGTKKTIIEAFRECESRIDVLTLEKLAKEKIEIQTELSSLVKLFDGVVELLDSLKKTTKIGLATMSGRKVIDKLLSDKKLEAYFEVVVSADDVNNPKPDPEVFLAAANKLGVDPKQCVVVEDSVFGIRAAKAASMKVIAVATGVYNKYELETENPDLLVESLVDREKILSFVSGAN
jgi:beta-phosphoglucomutase